MKASTVWLAIASVVACTGCTESTPDVTPEMHTDSSNDDEHDHGGEHDHGHGDGLAGTHSHDHSHNRSLGKPLHGGRIVPIGHAHHKGGVTHFHASHNGKKGKVQHRGTPHVLTTFDELRTFKPEWPGGCESCSSNSCLGCHGYHYLDRLASELKNGLCAVVAANR